MQKIDINEILESVNLQEDSLKNAGQVHHELENARGEANHLRSQVDNMTSCLKRARDAAGANNEKSLGMVKHYIDAARIESVKKQLGEVEKTIKKALSHSK